MSEFGLRSESREIDGSRVAIIHVAGDLDAHTFPKLQSLFESLVEKGESRFVLDGTQMDYVSSAGLGVLKGMARRLRDDNEKKGDIRLAGLTKKISTIVELLGFSRLLRVYATLEEAVRSYRK